jgi:hypothetical protein
MTVSEIMARGFTTRRERGEIVKLAWLNQESARRFVDLSWMLEARRVSLRSAHRRWLRKHGRHFK